MIVLYHQNGRVVDTHGAQSLTGKKITEAFVDAARLFPEAILVWCDQRLRNFLNLSEIPDLLHHKRLMFSYNSSKEQYFGPTVGFCEETTPFIAVRFDVKYPTWQMSGQVGAMHAETINVFAPYLHVEDNFDYFLNSFAKRAMRSGLICYSDPNLLKADFPSLAEKKAGIFPIFKFVRQHYRMRWTSLVLLDMLLYKRRFPILPYLFSVFYRKRQSLGEVISTVPMQSTRNIINLGTLDVVIPTIGRRDHFHNVLKDLALQTYLPKRVIVVEQNPEPGSVSDLDFIRSEKWPFEIDHVFTHRTGACAARNVALMRTQSEFVFMADDDIRFQAGLIEQVFEYFRKTGNEIIQISGPQSNEKIEGSTIVQHTALGSGLVFMKTKCLDGVWFNPGFEFGYGEDKDFGIQLRRKGFDILLVPFIHVLHLKAPMGGFRSKPSHPWEREEIQPKPSPTVMLHMTRNMTPEQFEGYKTVYFFKNWRKRGRNPFRIYANFKKSWQRSLFWANELGKL
ncbi:glycosyltransferase [Flavobacterium sp.]|uniref:glycosyltransferase family 2 protein n=1 Tax=Flavobacterium sp. TaxID=239 RepID=UPI0012188822|nr:glycosyltransferase [Flavobacterium sp.]RZJ70868.1 MAG: glycosyltransferase [Flavobacterium sp.]